MCFYICDNTFFFFLKTKHFLEVRIFWPILTTLSLNIKVKAEVRFVLVSCVLWLRFVFGIVVVQVTVRGKVLG